MKKLFLFLILIIAGVTANAQYTPYNNLNYVKLLKVPPTGAVEDSVLVYSGSDSFVKMRPSSELVPDHNSLSGLQGGTAGQYNHLTDAQVSLVNGSEQTSNKQNSLTPDGTGTKFPTVDAVNAALPITYATVVYVNSSDPNTATIFDSENPHITDNPSLESDTDNLYIADDASTWIYNGSVYVTKAVTSETSNFYLSGTSTDAGASKTGHIYRVGKTSIGGDIVSKGIFNVFTGTSGLGLDLAIQPSGVIGFYNNAASLATPTMAGKSTNSIGLSLMSATNDSNPIDSDMEFNARRDNGEDFSTLTSTAFRFKRFGTALVDILRNGNTGFGTMNPQAKIDINSAINEPSIAVAGFPVMRYSTGDVLDIGAFGSTWSAIRLLSGGVEAITMSGGSASLKNTPTAPTAAPGSTGTQIANVDYVNTVGKRKQYITFHPNQTFVASTSWYAYPNGLTTGIYNTAMTTTAAVDSDEFATQSKQTLNQMVYLNGKVTNVYYSIETNTSPSVNCDIVLQVKRPPFGINEILGRQTINVNSSSVLGSFSSGNLDLVTNLQPLDQIRLFINNGNTFVNMWDATITLEITEN